MDWQSIISMVVGSGIVVGIVEWMRFHKKDKADAKTIEADADSKATDNALKYAGKLEERLDKMEEKVDKMELRITVYQRAINCAYRCKRVENPEDDCPAVAYLNEEPSLNDDQRTNPDGD